MSRKKILGAVALGCAFLVLHYAPKYAVRNSVFWTFLSVFSVELSILLVWSVFVYPELLSPMRKYPTAPGGYPMFGHFIRLMKDPTGEPQKEWMNSIPNDGLIRYSFMFNEERVMPTTPKALAEVLVHKNYEFIKPIQLREGLGRILGIGLLLAEGDEHRRQRKNLMPAFAFRHIKDLYPIFWKKTREGVDAMEADLGKSRQGVLEIGGWASRITLDIIGLAGLGRDFDSTRDPSNELNETYQRIFRPDLQARIMQILGLIIPVWILRALPVKRNEEFVEAIKTIKKVAHDLIQNKRAAMEKGQRPEADILSVALESGAFTDEDLVNQLMTFLAAGHETTASAIVWAAYLLASHPDAQKRLREEIRESLPSISDTTGTVSSPEIDRMPYLNAVCNEVLRLWSPVPLTIRVADHDTTIAGHFVPRGTPIVLPIWAINTHKALWGPDADEFNPDRWLGPGKANTGGADSNYAFMTFLHGPRSCIGQTFAKAEFACLLAGIVGRFDLRFQDDNFKLEIQGGITSRPKGGLPLKVTALEGW